MNIGLRLGYRGYDWLKPEGVRRELERMVSGRGAAAPQQVSVPPVTVSLESPVPSGKGSWLSKLLGKGKK